MNILLLAWNRFRKRRPKGNVGHELFRRNLAKYHNVLLYGRAYFCGYNPSITIHELFEIYGKPDFIFTHVEHREQKFSPGIIDELGETNILKIHYCGDYTSSSQDGYDDHFRRAQYDIIFVRYSPLLIDFQKRGVKGNHFILPIGVDTSIYYDQHLEKILDVATPINVNEQRRRRLKKFINQLDIKTATEKASFDKYIKRINESKIIATCNWKDHRELSPKYTEVMACGTLLMGNKPADFDWLGFKDGEHMILYDSLKDLENKIEYFLKHDREREAIAKNGMEFVRKYHNLQVRIAEFIEMIQTRKQIDWSERIKRQFIPIFEIHRIFRQNLKLY